MSDEQRRSLERRLAADPADAAARAALDAHLEREGLRPVLLARLVEALDARARWRFCELLEYARRFRLGSFEHALVAELPRPADSTGSTGREGRADLRRGLPGRSG